MATKTSAVASPRESILDYFDRNPAAHVRCGTLAKTLKLNSTACAEALNRMCAAAGSTLRRKKVFLGDAERNGGLKEQYEYWIEPAVAELPIPSTHAGKPAYKGVGKLSPRAQDAMIPATVAAVPEVVTAPVIDEAPAPVVDPCADEAGPAIEANAEPQEAPVVDPVVEVVDPEDLEPEDLKPEHVFDDGLLEIHLRAIHHKDVAIAALESDLAAEVERTGRARAKAAAAEAQSERLIEELHALKDTIIQRAPVAVQPAAALGDPEGYIVGHEHLLLSWHHDASMAQESAVSAAKKSESEICVYAAHLVGRAALSVQWQDARPAVAAAEAVSA